MNKWENSFKKASDENSCRCVSNQGLFIPNRQLSFVVAGLMFLFFALFMTGYFLGKKKIVEQLSHDIQQEAFADQIYTTVLAQEQEQKNDVVEQPIMVVENTQPSQLMERMEHVDEQIALQEATQHYYAQLIGFGTEKAAQSFVQKLAAKGIETEIKKHTSKTAKGKVSYWYQVITSLYANEHELKDVVARLEKEENIKGTSIRKGFKDLA
jgi:hypothetical protein